MSLMKENKLSPSLRFGEFKENWNQVILGSISKSISSGKSKEERFGEFDLYGSTGKIGLCSQYSNDGKFILAARVGANAGLLNFVNGTFGVTDNALVIDINENNDINFIYYCLTSFNLRRLIFGSGQPLITAGQLKKLKILTPGLKEQKKAAEFISSVDKKIQLLENKKEQLELYKKGLFQKIFSQEIRFKDDNGNSYPDWAQKRLDEISDIKKGKQLNKSELTELGAYPCINGGVNPSGYTENWNRNENTITISEGGNSCGYVNYLKTKFWCGGHCYSLLNLSELVFDTFLFQLLKNNEQKIMRLRVGSGLPNIQLKEISKIILRLPILDEQKKIADFLSSIDKKIDCVSVQIDKTREFKKGLLQQMFI